MSEIVQRPDGVERSLAEWAEAEDSVRGLALVGSRASPRARVDALSDYDVMLFLGRSSALLDSDAWLEGFGPILVMLPEAYDLLGQTVPTRLVQYRSGVRIDFSLAPVALLERLTEDRKSERQGAAGRSAEGRSAARGSTAGGSLPELLDAGYRVLVDKDERLSRLPPPTGAGFAIRPPPAAEYQRVVNEFWWESVYVAKNLARGELLPAKYSAERVLRFDCLLPMLEWYARSRGGGEVQPGPHGRGLTGFLGKDDRRRLERTYAGSAVADNWDALFAMAALFERAAREVGETLGFAYPAARGQAVLDFLQRIRAEAPC